MVPFDHNAFVSIKDSLFAALERGPLCYYATRQLSSNNSIEKEDPCDHDFGM